MWRLNFSVSVCAFAAFCSAWNTSSVADPQQPLKLVEQLTETPLNSPGLSALRQAAAAGDGRAMINLAKMLLKGEGTAADPQQAIKLLEQASAAGLKGPAGDALGNYYRDIGDYQKALRAFQQAADAGEGWAMINLAEMLLKGEGTKTDRKKAQVLLDIALREKKVAFAYVGLTALAGVQFRSGNAISPTLSLLREAYLTDNAIALESFSELPRNSKVAVIQSILRDAALYSGPVDGRLTTATVKAIRRFCTRNNIAECNVDALPMPLLQALLPALGTDDPVGYFQSSEHPVGQQADTPRRKSKRPVKSAATAKIQSASVAKSPTSKKKIKKPVETTANAKQQAATVAKQAPDPKKKSRESVESTGVSDQQATSAARPSAVSMETAPVGQSLAPKDEEKKTSKSSARPGKCYIVAGACRSLSRNSQSGFFASDGN
jgi:peptidoglycan hydrolase-like protein with peptidoglycan-binding domain